MTLPEGHTSFDRVVDRVDGPLEVALEDGLTGYGVVVPQGNLLGEDSGKGILWFEDGIPIGARHTGTGRTGSAALADLAEIGPYQVRMVATGTVPETYRGNSLPPAAPADRLAGNEALAARTREAAGSTAGGGPEAELDAVEAFLADEEKIEAIKQQAAAEARRRAAEWGFETTDPEE